VRMIEQKSLQSSDVQIRRSDGDVDSWGRFTNTLRARGCPVGLYWEFEGRREAAYWAADEPEDCCRDRPGRTCLLAFDEFDSRVGPRLTVTKRASPLASCDAVRTSVWSLRSERRSADRGVD